MKVCTCSPSYRGGEAERSQVRGSLENLTRPCLKIKFKEMAGDVAQWSCSTPVSFKQNQTNQPLVWSFNSYQEMKKLSQQLKT
jgi:hypothetical protein